MPKLEASVAPKVNRRQFSSNRLLVPGSTTKTVKFTPFECLAVLQNMQKKPKKKTDCLSKMYEDGKHWMVRDVAVVLRICKAFFLKDLSLSLSLSPRLRWLEKILLCCRRWSQYDGTICTVRSANEPLTECVNMFGKRKSRKTKVLLKKLEIATDLSLGVGAGKKCLRNCEHKQTVFIILKQTLRYRVGAFVWRVNRRVVCAH